MIDTRRVALDVRYNGTPFILPFGPAIGGIVLPGGQAPVFLSQGTAMVLTAGTRRTMSAQDGTGQIGADVESMTYVDNAEDNSDSIDLTINAQDGKWAAGWMPNKGASVRARIVGRSWERTGDTRALSCGLFVLDDIAYNDAPTTIKIGGVSKPSNTDFSELEREQVWKETSIARIGATIAARYGLGFMFDAEDYRIETSEQDGTDSSYYNELCKNYGLILKVYAMRLWVYDRERYKAKRPVKLFHRTQIKRGSFSWSTTLSGTFTGGDFTYTDADKDADIVCHVGGGTHTKSVSRRASDVLDASIQLCAEINNANHGNTKVRFTVDGEWLVSAGNCIAIAGYGPRIDGKYFVDKVTHRVSKGSGYSTDIECSLVEKPFFYWEVGGSIEYHGNDDASSEDYQNNYEETSAAANAANTTAGALAGAAVTLSNAPFYHTSTTNNPSSFRSGTFYYYDGILVNGRYRMAVSADRCGKLPMSENVTDWVRASDCNSGGSSSSGSGGSGSSGGTAGGGGSAGSGGNTVNTDEIS